MALLYGRFADIQVSTQTVLVEHSVGGMIDSRHIKDFEDSLTFSVPDTGNKGKCKGVTVLVDGTCP